MPNAVGVKAAINARTERLRSCYERGLHRRPDLTGKHTYTIDIDVEGRVTHVAFDEDTVRDAEFAVCVVEHISQWRFGPQEDSGQVTFTVVFWASDPSRDPK